MPAGPSFFRSPTIWTSTARSDTAVVLALDPLDDLGPGEDPAGTPGQEVQQAELGGGQVHGPALDQDLVAAGVDGHFVEFQGVARRRRFRLAAAQHRPEPGQEHPGAEGLDDVVVGPQLQARHDVRLLPLGGEDDDGDLPGPGVLLEFPAHREPVHPRQHQVQDDEVRGR